MSMMPARLYARFAVIVCFTTSAQSVMPDAIAIRAAAALLRRCRRGALHDDMRRVLHLPPQRCRHDTQRHA